MRDFAVVLTGLACLVACSRNPQPQTTNTRSPQPQTTNNVPLQGGVPLDKLPDLVRGLAGASEMPPLHHFTVQDLEGHEVVGVSIVCAATRFLVVFKDRSLSKILYFDDDNAFQDGAVSNDSIQEEVPLVKRAFDGASLSLDEVRQMCQERQIAAQHAESKKEPLGILKVFPKEDHATQKKQHIELMRRLDSTKVRLNDSQKVVTDLFGPPSSRRQEGDSTVQVYTATVDLGWYPVPEISVWFLNNKTYRVVTKYPRPKRR